MKPSLIDKMKQLDDQELQVLEDLVDVWINRKQASNGKEEELPEDFQPVYEEKVDYTASDLQAIADQYPAHTRWTYDLLQKAFPFEYKVHVEIINYQLYIMPSPSEQHQEITGELYIHLKTYAKKHQLGKVIIAPFDVVLEEGKVVAPDVLFVSVARQDILDGKKATGAPDLVVEVLSPANYKKLREEKKNLYEEAGVREYWEIYIPQRSCQIHVLKAGKYEIHSQAEAVGEVHSLVLEGFSIHMQDLFENLD